MTTFERFRLLIVISKKYSFLPVMSQYYIVLQICQTIEKGVSMLKRVAIYARVSTHDQKTLPMQLEKCSCFASSRGWEVTMNINEVGSGAVKRPDNSS